jgi:D-cysteine desulfhydrase
MRPRLRLAHLPTPLWRWAALDSLCGTEVWVKRDDMTAGAEAGNKIRKLEYLLAAAMTERATTIVTCGGVQSNHARATALCAASLGLSCVLLLRTATPSITPAVTGNLMLDRLAGAEVRFISPDDYRRRNEVMAEVGRELAQKGQRPYLIPEGGSNALGALGYAEAMREVRQQLDLGLAGGPQPFDAIVHACGSGGTAAGIVLGAAEWEVARTVHAIAVCDDIRYFESVIGRIVIEAQKLDPALNLSAELRVHDRWKGPGYAVASDEQRRFIREVAQKTGLVVDPVYSGKALFALSQLEPKPKRVLFVHTGGLPGLLAASDAFANDLG